MNLSPAEAKAFVDMPDGSIKHPGRLAALRGMTPDERNEAFLGIIFALSRGLREEAEDAPMASERMAA